MTIAALMVATVGMRVHESIPHLALIHPSALAAYGGICLVLTRTSRVSVRQAFDDPVFRIICFYFVWMTLISPFALWPGLAISTIQIAPPMICMVLALLLCRPDLRHMNQGASVFLASAAALGGLALLSRETMIDSGAVRLTALGSLDANDLAAAMAMAFPFAIALSLRARAWRRLVGLVIGCLLLVVVLRSGSRGGAAALVVGGLVFTLGFRGSKRFVILAALIAAALLAWEFAPAGFRDRFATVTSEADYNYTAYSGRKQIWARGRGYIAQHPLVGVGPGNFPIAEGDFAAELGRPAKWSAAHNAYLQAFAELGLVGGGIFVCLLGMSLRRALRLWNNRTAQLHRPEFAAALAAFMTSANFLSHAYFYPLFALVGVIALADRARRFSIQPGSSPISMPKQVIPLRVHTRNASKLRTRPSAEPSA